MTERTRLKFSIAYSIAAIVSVSMGIIAYTMGAYYIWIVCGLIAVGSWWMGNRRLEKMAQATRGGA